MLACVNDGDDRDLVRFHHVVDRVGEPADQGPPNVTPDVGALLRIASDERESARTARRNSLPRPALRPSYQVNASSSSASASGSTSKRGLIGRAAQYPLRRPRPAVHGQDPADGAPAGDQIGRASCRERVYISVVAGPL